MSKSRSEIESDRHNGALKDREFAVRAGVDFERHFDQALAMLIRVDLRIDNVISTLFRCRSLPLHSTIKEEYPIN